MNQPNIYADIIIDISHESLDQTYQYTQELEAKVLIGSMVKFLLEEETESLRDM